MIGKKILQNKKAFWVIALLVTLGLTSCSSEATSYPQTWIDNPRDGASLAVNKPVMVKSHTFMQSDVSEVVLSVNGEAYRRDVPTKGAKDFVSVDQEWVPDKPGNYLLQVQGYDVQGHAAQPASISVRVAGITEIVAVVPVISITPTMTATATSTMTPTMTFTPVISITPTLRPESKVSFYAEPGQINAGECSTIYWNVENANRVIFGGTDQQFVGSYKDCMCSSRNFTLRVFNKDGVEKQYTAHVSVNGTCETHDEQPQSDSQPQPDTNPPTVPVPAVPANGLTLSCRSSQTLVWQPSTDDVSGISLYYVKLEKQIKRGTWQSAGGYGPVKDKQVTVNVDCGIQYRWMVRAKDGAGNYSAWSSASTFSVNLD